MDHDYYEILNVDPAADPEAILKAYLRRAMIDHPDRGGSDERMKLVNEAFAVLSDPELRRHHDAARANRADAAAQVTAAEDAERARRQAADYPRSWPEFERWVNRVGTDFSQARYSSWNHGMWYSPGRPGQCHRMGVRRDRRDRRCTGCIGPGRSTRAPDPESTESNR
jgi:curved DNA-binding protein CbpA